MGSLPSPAVLSTIDDLVRTRGDTCTGIPILAYPRAGGSLTSFEYFTAHDLDRFVEWTAQKLLTLGLRPMSGESAVAGILAPPDNLELLMTACGLSRLGYTALILSPRLAVTAYVALIEETKCSILLHSSTSATTVASIQQSQQQLRLVELPLNMRNEFTDHKGFKEHLKRGSSPPDLTEKTAIIMHSSGSTGVPKPIYQTHKSCLANSKNHFQYSTFLTLPLYHAYGFSSIFRALAGKTLLILFDWTYPLTAENVVKVVEATQPEMVSVVPYTLMLLAESQQGIDALKTRKLVTFHGSACPDSVGDHLVKQGVNLVAHLGSTEAGALATSSRPSGDNSWNYFRFLPSVKPHLWLKPIGSETYELVLLQSLKTKVLSNSNDPPNSLYTKDLFTPHPSIPEAWKYIGRQDDRITLSNGEKVLPLPIEGRIKKHRLIKEAIVFGVGRAVPGVLVFRSAFAATMSDVDFMSSIWPIIEQANKQAETFSQIGKNMVIVFPSDMDYPRTDKGSLIRNRAYEVFKGDINGKYNQLDFARGGDLRLNKSELNDYLLKLCNERLELEIDNIDRDLFSAGLNSLRAIHMSSIMKSELDLGVYSKSFSQQTIYRCATLNRLSDYLQDHEAMTDLENQVDFLQMEELITKYSTLHPHFPVDRAQSYDGHVVVITGATGSLGGHILSQLVTNSSVRKVFCLARLQSEIDPRARLRTSLIEKGLEGAFEYPDKIVVLNSDLSREDLGLDTTTLQELLRTTTLIIHCAWAVNFNLGIQSFEDDHIRGVQNLLNFSMSIQDLKPAQVLFCSSVSVARGTAAPAIIPEALITDLSQVTSTGYAQSKLVAEHLICNAAARGARSCVLRIGQIVGDAQTGRWNDSEAIPLMIRSALTLHALPKLSETCSWMPVDLLAKAIIELSNISSAAAESQTYPAVYNLVHPVPFSWTQDLLPALCTAGLDFLSTSPSDWVTRLRKSEQDALENPTIKLLDFFELRYGNGKADDLMPEIQFATEKAQAKSLTMRELPDLLKEGYVGRFVEEWLKKWKA